MYAAVSPLAMERGARRLTLRQAAGAACLSVGGLYHYFPTKRALLLHGLDPRAMARLCTDLQASLGRLPASDPEKLIDSYIDRHIQEAFFVRPAIHAALEFGVHSFWESVDSGLSAGLGEFAALLRRVVPEMDEERATLASKAIRRALVAAVMDRTATPDELRRDLRAIIDGYSDARRSEAAPVAV